MYGLLPFKKSNVRLLETYSSQVHKRLIFKWDMEEKLLTQDCQLRHNFIRKSYTMTLSFTEPIRYNVYYDTKQIIF